ncbi:MAG: WecB/TagA/CpsF family glycosyltransferase [Phycisphaerae bacterium]|nr:WecB/TagA/CpsF family glycosyltransferase [Phycisphaerae bacterium]
MNPPAPPVLPAPVPLGATTIHPVSEEHAVSHVIGSILAGRGGWLITCNLDHLRRCGFDPSWAELIGRADLRVADGMPLVWAGRLQGTPLPGRVTGSNLIRSVNRGLGQHGRSAVFIGGNPGAAEQAATILMRDYPGLRILACACPPFGFEKDARAMADLRDMLARTRPDVVFIALSSPKQDFVIRDLRDALPSAWWIGVGISFSFVTGEVARAPKWVQKLGLEWLHRLVQEPRKLARRYLIDGIPFALRLLLGSAFARLRGPRAPLVSNESSTPAP